MGADSIAAVTKRSVNWSIVLSVLMIVAGIAAVVVPPIAGVAVAVFIGWLLMISGVAHLVLGWHVRSAGGLVWQIILGLVYGIAGIVVLLNPVAGLVALALFLGAYLCAEAALEFVLAWRMRGLPGRGWLVFDGVVTLVLSFMVWSTWPSSSAWVIGTLVGISMILSGGSRLMVLSAANRRLRLAV